MTDDCLPDCMMPDGGQCCAGYHKQRQRIEALETALWKMCREAEIARAVLAPEQDK